MNKKAFKKALTTQLSTSLAEVTELEQMKQQIVNITETLQYVIQKTVPLVCLSKWLKPEFRSEVKKVIQKVNRA